MRKEKDAEQKLWHLSLQFKSIMRILQIKPTVTKLDSMQNSSNKNDEQIFLTFPKGYLSNLRNWSASGFFFSLSLIF